MGDTKKYGLIISKKKSSVGVVKKSSVFGNESSDEEDASKAINVSLLREAEKKKQMKQTQIEVQKALAEDPTVYEYDTIYDQMQEKKKPQVLQVAEKDRKPKYIKGLLKSAAERKLEFERQIERKAQREREAEGDAYADKEAFVTTAYKKKMQEWAEEEERLKRQELIDAANDVTKQTDLSQFYRNLLNKNVSMGGAYEAETEKLSTEKLQPEEGEKDTPHRTDRTTKSSSKGAGDKSPDERRGRHESSRRRRRSDSDDEHEHRRYNDRERRRRSDRADEDSFHKESRDRRHDRDSDNRRREDEDFREKCRSSSEKTPETKGVRRELGEETVHKDRKDNDKNKETKKRETEEKRNKEQTEKQKSEEVASKFAKRSTGDSVMSARERYLARKAARETSKASRAAAESDED